MIEPNDLTAEDVIRGECNIPEELFNFECDLVQRSDARRKNSSEDLVNINICVQRSYLYCIKRQSESVKTS